MCHSSTVALFLPEYPSPIVHDSRCCEGLHASGLSPATLGLLSCCLTSLETVTEMPKGPVAERGDHGVAAEKKVCLRIPRPGDLLLRACVPEAPKPPARL